MADFVHDEFDDDEQQLLNAEAADDETLEDGDAPEDYVVGKFWRMAFGSERKWHLPAAPLLWPLWPVAMSNSLVSSRLFEWAFARRPHRTRTI